MFAGCYLFIILLVGGCATPAGELFPTMDRVMVWPAPPDVPRIRLIGSLGSSADLKAALPGGEVFKAAFRGPRPSIPFSSPHGLAIHESHQLAIADSAGGCVHLIDLNARTHSMTSGFGDQRLKTPVGVTWANGRWFVTDAQRGEILELNHQGQIVGQHAQWLSRPVGITYSEKVKKFFVVDGGKHEIVVLDSNLTLLERLGRRGSAPGEFNYPTHIACQGDRLLVADSGNFRVQLLDLEGNPIRMIGRKGDAAGDLSMPKGVTFDRDGHIYVADAHFENVQVFDETGQLLMAFGQEGGGAGFFSLPAGLCFDDQDRLWVADSGNRRLQVFEYLIDR